MIPEKITQFLEFLSIRTLHEILSKLEAIMRENSTNKIELFTDGACSGNPGPGGWGAILRWRGIDKELYGGEANTTNNRMEALAVIQGLKALKKSSIVTVYTDSTYVQKGMTEWLEGWKAKGYKIKGGGLRVNHDLWQELDALNQTHQVSWQWVKGHAGHPENERADELARQGVDLVR
jgi:ribonuclease HI